jgi:hypothetical protein
MGEAGPSQFDGDLLGDGPVESFEAIADRACAVASSVEDFDAAAHLSLSATTRRASTCGRSIRSARCDPTTSRR